MTSKMVSLVHKIKELKASNSLLQTSLVVSLGKDAYNTATYLVILCIYFTTNNF